MQLTRPRGELARRGRLRAAVVAALVCLASTSAGLAGWREEMKTFRVGMIASDGSGQAVPGLSILKRAYTLALGIPVEIFVARDYAALVDAQATGRVDYAIYSTAAYATAEVLCSCVEPVVAPTADGGATGTIAILVTRDKRLPGLSDLATHRIAIPPADSVSGAMLPLTELAGQGVAVGESQSWLVQAESASAAEAMLIDGSVDAIFGWVPAPAEAVGELTGGTLDRLVAAGLDRASLDVVWQSLQLRYGPHTLRAGLDGEIRTILVKFLTGLKGRQPDVYDLLESAHGGGFVEVRSEDYASAVEMIRRLGQVGKEK